MTVQAHTADTAAAQVALRQALSLFPTGVVAVCALSPDGDPVGIAVNSFTSISLDPPLVGICVARTSATWPLLASRPRLGLSILGSHQGTLCRALASRTGSRFDDAAWTASDGGAVLMDGAALWLEVEVEDIFEGGDHEIIVLKVVETQVFADVTPLVFHQSQFRALQISQ